ncbi:MAG: DinB family protein [Anaerolineae bacterium]|nr:DinB family protein [Anaerolineae bacterium]
MHAQDVVKYGHLWVLKHLKDLDEKDWAAPDVCGWWSTKDIIAHLISFEKLFCDVFEVALGGEPGPILTLFFSAGAAKFNDSQVELRTDKSVTEILDELANSQNKAAALLVNIPLKTHRKTGLFPWYGEEYDLEDMITYMHYSHIREHCAQIAIFRSSLDPDWKKG